MLILYDVALSPFAQKVKLALLEKGIAFETRAVDLGGPDAAFRAASPRLEVPALVDDGVAVFDSSIILQYLEDKWPEPALLPASPADRARVRMIEEVCDTQVEAINWGMNELLNFKRAEGEQARQMLARAADELKGVRGWLSRQLGGRPWFNGDAFGFGDIAVFPYLQIAALYKQGPEEGSPLADWLGRMRARDSARRVVDEAKAALPAFREMGAKFMSGERQRQYRDHRLEWMLRAGGADIVAQGLDKGTIRFSTLPS